MPLIQTKPLTSDQQTVVTYATQIQRQWNQLGALFTQIADFIWNNPTGLTPQQAFDVFGTDGGSLCALSTAYLKFLADVGAPAQSPVPSNVTVTVNPDGTVTLS